MTDKENTKEAADTLIHRIEAKVEAAVDKAVGRAVASHRTSVIVAAVILGAMVAGAIVWG